MTIDSAEILPIANTTAPTGTRPSAASLRDLVREHADRFQPILAALRDQPWRELLTASELMDALTAQGQQLSERTLRLHCAELCEAGLILREGKRGYRLTDIGVDIARELTASRRLGSILYRMEETMCQLTFDPERHAGLVSINAYVLPITLLRTLVDEIDAVYRAGLAVGDRVLLAGPGDDILGREVPAGHVGLGTICSLTLAGLLMRRGVPTQPIFGGLLQVSDGKPAHVLEMVRYDSTSLSPNEMFIRAHLTSVGTAARSGSGAITASFRELPMNALPALRDAVTSLDERKFSGILAVGRPGLPLMNIPVHEGRVGLVLATGLNPLACLWENAVLHASSGEADASRPMVGPADYDSMIPLTDLRARAAALIATAGALA
ncbi:MAG: NrpR regulatory domain-containing protein [Planctomycetota bacterium]